MQYKGIIIEESLANKTCLKNVHIISTKVEQVTEAHKTPWIKQWTMHTILIDEDKAETVAIQLSDSLERIHNWFADFKNDTTHYIIFRNKVFKIDRTKSDEYQQATDYGISLGIPRYQVDFAPNVLK